MGPVFGCCLILTLMYNNWGCDAEECLQTVKAYRDNKVVIEGKSLLLSCEVQHCGMASWSGGWGILKEDTFSPIQASARFHIYNDNLPNSTRLNINFISTNKSDSGTYQCRINWGQTSSNGHVTYVNVTDANSHLGHHNRQEQSERMVLMRVVLIICGGLTFPLALALVWRLCHQKTSPPVPPRSNSATTQRERPNELVYAALALDSERHPNQRKPQPTDGHTVVYSSLRM